MRFDIYGKSKLDIVRDGDRWKVYALGEGKRTLLGDVVIPPEITEHEVAIYLDDLFHELARPGQTIRRID